MVKAGSVAAGLGLALLVGGMVFFGAVVAPLIFTKLPAADAGVFIRAIFPFYFLYVAVGAGVAAMGFLGRRQAISAAVMAVVFIEALWAWVWLIPHLNAWREAGDVGAFRWGHDISTWANGAEILAAGWLLVRLVLG
jgi:hypothetical protein